MKKNSLKTIVDEALTLDREIAEKTERLKELKTQLVHEAETRPDECSATDGGGKSWRTFGTDGCIARVSFPSPSLKSAIDSEDKTLPKLRKVAGKLFEQLFTPKIAYRPALNFRQKAGSILSHAEAQKLIKLCQKESSPRVSFETTDRDHEVTEDRKNGVADTDRVLLSAAA